MIASRHSIHTATRLRTKYPKPPLPPSDSNPISEENQSNEPSSTAKRIAQKAAISSRNDYFNQLVRMGMDVLQANQRSNVKYVEDKQFFSHQIQRNLDEARTGRAAALSTKRRDTFSDLRTQAREHIKLGMDAFDEYPPQRRYQPPPRPTIQYHPVRDHPIGAPVKPLPLLLRRRPVVGPNPNAPKIFGQTNLATMDLNFSEAREQSLEFWRTWEQRAAEITNQAMGPSNAFEEQIEWTRQGKLWPYPIDNEWRIGEEEQTSFIDHVFLEPELAKHKLPKSKPVDHFMELVLTGLSKNPYMSVSKKREHIDWFASYFKSAMKGKYKELLIKQK